MCVCVCVCILWMKIYRNYSFKFQHKTIKKLLEVLKYVVDFISYSHLYLFIHLKAPETQSVHFSLWKVNYPYILIYNTYTNTGEVAYYLNVCLSINNFKEKIRMIAAFPILSEKQYFMWKISQWKM